uniref:uncharacterized protein LOC120342316 n=1 Tax=Styela clava TaxID=7725 RepID=UPI0019399559|nr:uncharacterized protein LOC120342316 [Styela clava]
MKTAIIVALFVVCIQAGIVKRQTDVLFDTDVNGRVCYVGENGNYTMDICPESEQMCQTAIRIENGNIQITNSCKQDKACMNNQDINIQNCIGDEAFRNNVRVCHFCCESDLCNNEYDLDTLLLIAGQYREPSTVATFLE